MYIPTSAYTYKPKRYRGLEVSSVPFILVNYLPNTLRKQEFVAVGQVFILTGMHIVTWK